MVVRCPLNMTMHADRIPFNSACALCTLAWLTTCDVLFLVEVILQPLKHVCQHEKKGVEFPEMMSFRNMFIQARSMSLLKTPLGLTMINLLNLSALRPRSHVLRQGPCSFRQSWNPAVSSCPSLQCSGKVTCHDSHHVSETISMMQAGLKDNKSHGNIRNIGLPEPQHASDTSRATTKNDFLRSEDRRCHRFKVLRFRMVWCKSGLLIGSMADTSCHKKRQELRNLMICFIYCTY